MEIESIKNYFLKNEVEAEGKKKKRTTHNGTTKKMSSDEWSKTINLLRAWENVACFADII